MHCFLKQEQQNKNGINSSKISWNDVHSSSVAGLEQRAAEGKGLNFNLKTLPFGRKI